jgi:hypothetical protein
MYSSDNYLRTTMDKMYSFRASKHIHIPSQQSLGQNKNDDIPPLIQEELVGSSNRKLTYLSTQGSVVL